MSKDDSPLTPRKPSHASSKEDARFSLQPGYRHPSFHPPRDPLLRRRSLVVAVGMAGMAAVGFAAFGGKDVQRNGYASLEDCEHDYATGQCTQDKPVSSGGTGGYHYYGPWYRSDWRNGRVDGDPGPGRSYASGASAGFAGHGPTSLDFGRRGGFGSTGRVSARGS